MRRATAKRLSLWLVLGSLCCSAFVNADPEHHSPGATVSNTDHSDNLTLENAYRIQSMEKRARESQGSEVVGYRAGLTSHTAQQRFDVAAPVSGILYADMATPGRELPLADFSQPMLEVELGFILARPVEGESALDLPISTLIAEVVPVIEIPDL